MSEASWRDGLAARDAQDLRRSLRIVERRRGDTVRCTGRDLVNFGSNDYLDLASDPRVIEAACRAVREWGWGTGGSRLVCGTFGPHAAIEAQLAELAGTKRALLFSSGYQANLAAVCAGAGEGDVIFSDARNHASLIDGCRLSRARAVVFPHRDYDALETLLRTNSSTRRKLIVTESLFSVDGGFASLSRLVALKATYGATLCVDEAHAFGVYGTNGGGLAEMQGVRGRIDITVGTLSKALGGIGGFVCGSAALIDWLVNSARPFIFSTAPPAPVAAAALAALEIVATEPQRRKKVLALAAELRTELGDRRGHDLSTSASQIVPLIVGESRRVVDLSAQLLERGFFVPAMRPPSVPLGTARLRISVTAAHDRDRIGALTAALGVLQPVGGR